MESGGFADVVARSGAGRDPQSGAGASAFARTGTVSIALSIALSGTNTQSESRAGPGARLGVLCRLVGEPGLRGGGHARHL
ncbi:hypothetical protein C7418_2374 [Cupriavidus plantarum]|nr:hypothetical protein C7418_2374 [Cupriavidus plantarum]